MTVNTLIIYDGKYSPPLVEKYGDDTTLTTDPQVATVEFKVEVCCT